MEAVQTQNPTVVTLDLGLADMDGFKVIRQLRLFSDACIVMLTARAEELDTLRGLEASADDCMTRPSRRTQRTECCGTRHRDAGAAGAVTYCPAG